MFLTLILISATLAYLLWKTQYSNYWRKKKIVQVNGVTWKFATGKGLPELYKDVYDAYPNEPYVGIFVGARPILILRDLENVQAVMASDFLSFHQRGIPISSSKDVLANNVLFIDNYARWKLIRQKVSPIFTSFKLRNMFYILEHCARDFAFTIHEQQDFPEKPFNVLYNYSVASIAASIFGIDTNKKNTMDSPFHDMTRKSVTLRWKNMLCFFLSSISPKLLDLLDVRVFKEHEEFFVGVVRKVLEDRKNDTQKRHDFIDMCVELQQQGTMKDLQTGYEVEPTVEVLAAQAFFLFIAGGDTSSNTMHFTLLELSNRPDILERVHKEIDQVFDECNENVTYTDLDKLEYLGMVVDESMRMYPPIGLIQRKCARDTVLPVGKAKIKKDDIVVIPVFGLHRDEKYYPNPDVFDPERFSPKKVADIPKYAYQAFGEGNRICLGMRFARIQVKIGLAWLLRKYTLRQQKVKIEAFEVSAFSLRVPDARYDLIPRNRQNVI